VRRPFLLALANFTSLVFRVRPTGDDKVTDLPPSRFSPRALCRRFPSPVCRNCKIMSFARLLPKLLRPQVPFFRTRFLPDSDVSFDPNSYRETHEQCCIPPNIPQISVLHIWAPFRASFASIIFDPALLPSVSSGVLLETQFILTFPPDHGHFQLLLSCPLDAAGFSSGDALRTCVPSS